MVQNKFLLLFEEIMNSIITIDTFDYKFQKESNGNITCKFQTLNKAGELVDVETKISPTGTIKFLIKNNKNIETLNEKQFMLNFYKDYEKFKKAFKEFNQKNEKEKIKQEKNKNIISNVKTIPEIQSFSNKLQEINENNDGKPIKAGTDTFLFKQIDDKIKKLIQIKFVLINNQTDNEEIPKYNVTAFLKLKNKNSITVKFILKDPDEKIPEIKLSETEFHDKYPEVYENYKEAVNKFEQEHLQ